MRALPKERLDLIDALLAEGELRGITAAILEKDEHLTDALKALLSLTYPGMRLVFCGGSSLSKAHGLIERMSEDADLKVVLDPTTSLLSGNQLRQRLSALREHVETTLTGIELVQERQHAKSLNNNHYMHSQWTYARNYQSADGLRPNLQIELTTRTPVLPTDRRMVTYLADRLAGQTQNEFDVETVCIAETLAEKVLSFLRRFAQHRAGAMTRDWDTALVRHIHDVHCIHLNDPLVIEDAAPAFAALVAGDQVAFGRQHPEFSQDAVSVLTTALSKVKVDAQTHREYERNLLPLLYGNSHPNFEEAFTSFELVATQLIATLCEEDELIETPGESLG